jgi:O-methyltransferase
VVSGARVCGRLDSLLGLGFLRSAAHAAHPCGGLLFRVSIEFLFIMSNLRSFISENELDTPYSTVQRVIAAICSVNLNSMRVLLTKDPSQALNFVTHSHHLYSGFGLLHLWNWMPWRDDLRIPSRKIDEIFPEIDFVRSLEILYPFPRDLGVVTQELVVLTKVVSHFQAKRVIGFGTAEGRTALNIAAHLPPDGEIITLDLPPVPGKNEVGCFYRDQPCKAKIRQVFASVDAWDPGPYRGSADVVFCDACDRMPGLEAETFQAFSAVKPDGVIFRHDYGTAKGPTRFWDWLAQELPIFHIEGTFLLCLRVDSEATCNEIRKFLAHPVLKNSVHLPAA